MALRSLHADLDDQSIHLDVNGQHTVEMVAEDVAGYIATSSIQLNVVAEDVGATDIQNRTNWGSCCALISGSTCAARAGVAQSSWALHQSAPSLDRSASRFSPGGKPAYSNDLYWTPLGGGNSVAIFPVTFGFISPTATLRSRWHSM
jgi:hypothetical protein